MSDIRILAMFSLLALHGGAALAEDISEQELRSIIGAQMGMLAASVDAQMQYAMQHEGKSPDGCFDDKKAVRAYGETIEFQGVAFKCFKVQDGGLTVGQFHPVKLLRRCQSNPDLEGCKELDENLKQQFFSQL